MLRRGGRQREMGHSREDFWGALRGVWFVPRRFFAGLEFGGPVRPALFASVVLYLNLLLEAGLQALWVMEFNYALIYAPFVGLVVAVVFAPLLVAALAVLVLVVLQGGPSRHDFGPVFRYLCYASGIGIVLWVPFGPLLAIPYGAYVATVAVKTAMNTSWGRAASATLVPLGAAVLILLLLGADEAVGFLLNPPGS